MSIAWQKDANDDDNNDKNNKVETQHFSTDFQVNEKIKAAVTGLPRFIQVYFFDFAADHDKELVADFILSCVRQENVATNTKRSYIVALGLMARYLNGKPLESITSSDLKGYLNSMQRDENQDPDQSWIGKQRAFGLPLFKFFKWMAYPDLTPQERKRIPREKYPEVLKGFLLQRKKGSKTPVKNKDVWNDEDMGIFLKYCTDNPRLRFYHAMAYETSARPGELLRLKIGDIQVNSDADTGKLYAALDVGRYGKKRESRIVGITDFTIQYYQSYLQQQHRDPTNREAFLFLNQEHSAAARNIPIGNDSLRSDYRKFRKITIPRLLKRPDIPKKDKDHLIFLRDQKRWNPYIMRHSSISKLARDPNINEYTLRQHAGWTKGSRMIEIYTHELNGDSYEDVMMAYGIDLKTKKKRNSDLIQKELIGPHCPFCKMVNIPNNQFCSSCHRPLAPITMDRMLKEAEQAKRELAELKSKQEEASKSAEKRRYEIEDMQEKLKEVQKQIESLPGKLLGDMKRYEPEIVEEVKDKEKKTAKQILLELPKTKTWQGQAVLSKYALEEDQLNHAKNMLKECPERVVEMLNRKKTESH